MTIFSDNPHDRRIERFMTAIPNFKPRGVGVRFSESQVLITITAATPTAVHYQSPETPDFQGLLGLLRAIYYPFTTFENLKN